MGSRLGLTTVQVLILRRGGIASTAQLLASGEEWEGINIAANYRRIQHICKGWWAMPGIAAELVAARRAGGQLACISALTFRGLASDSVSSDHALHVLVPHSASRRRKSTADGRPIVYHFARRAPSGRAPVVSAAVAREQMRTCTALT